MILVALFKLDIKDFFMKILSTFFIDLEITSCTTATPFAFPTKGEIFEPTLYKTTSYSLFLTKDGKVKICQSFSAREPSSIENP